MSVFYISIFLEIMLVSRLARRRIKIEEAENKKLMAITIIILCLTYMLNNKTNFIYYYLIPIFVFMFYMDRTNYLIIDEFNLLLLIFGIIYMIFTLQLFPNLSSFLTFILIMILIKLIEKIIKKDLMGDGDLKLFIATSLIFSYKVFIIIFIASIISLGIEYLKRITKKNEVLIPFGPYLVIAYLITIYFL